MAKTKGSNPPVRELLYEDAGGILHYFGEFFRGIFKEGYISPDDPGVDITGQSTRGARPTQQGAGTQAQEEIRQRYKSCIDLWHSLPLVCPVPLPDPPPTSKESVWEAKQEHGVVCSYYDLFMRCCLKWARDHDNVMPNGDCFPCESLCFCDDVLIYYTTTSMQVNEQQTLSVLNPAEGCLYKWEIVSGGGGLSASSGLSVIFTAPDSNSECLQNAVISLSVGSTQCDSLPIAVNGYLPPTDAYRVSVCILDLFCEEVEARVYCSTLVHWHYFTCSGVYKTYSVCYNWGATGNSPPYFCPDFCPLYPSWTGCEERAAQGGCAPIGKIEDLRTTQMISDGCCPGPLL